GLEHQQIQHDQIHSFSPVAAGGSSSSHKSPTTIATTMIGTGVTPSHAAKHDPPTSSTARVICHAFCRSVLPPIYGFASIQTVAPIIPVTAADVTASAAIAYGCERHDSTPCCNITAIVADGSVTAITPKIAPGQPRNSDPTAAQNAMMLVPGVMRASE